MVVVRCLCLLLALCVLPACARFQGAGSETPAALRDVPPAPTVVPLVTSGNQPPVDGERPPSPINVPDGFVVTVYAKELGRPRDIAVAPDGAIVVSDLAGRVLDITNRGDDGVAQVVVVDEGLDNPHGVAFHDGRLYVGETGNILRYKRMPDGTWGDKQVVISGLPEGGNHRTRSLLFGRDGKLYVSIGSSCNVCAEDDERRASIMQFDADGTNGRIYARGLRNAVGITLHPESSEIWAVDNGRDMIGDDLPPEPVYVVQDGADYGWPRCHSGRIPDPEFGGPEACAGMPKPVVELPAHSAALGLTFYDAGLFPAEYRGNLFVAFHGSWNRTVRTGYKVVRIPFGADGRPGPAHDFATGWIESGWFWSEGQYWGRPVDVAVGPDGSLLVSDDKAGMVFQITYAGS